MGASIPPVAPLSATSSQEHTDSSNPTVFDAIEQSVNALGWQGPVGIGFPGVVEDNVFGAPNLGRSGRGRFFSLAHAHGVSCMLNDADCVAEGELHFGIGHRGHARVLTLTIGTGLGTTLHANGTLIPNLEYGRLPHPTRPGLLEHHVSGRTRTEQTSRCRLGQLDLKRGSTCLRHGCSPI